MKRGVIIIVAVILIAILLLLFLPSSEEQIQDINDISPIRLTSPAFGNNEAIPLRYTCNGEDVNPPLEISEVPEGTQSLVLIMTDPDASGGTWDHWIVYNIPATTKIIAIDSLLGSQGLNSWGEAKYGGPCPPSGTHNYKFILYALDSNINFITTPTKAQIESAIQDNVIEFSVLTGTYSKV